MRRSLDRDRGPKDSGQRAALAAPLAQRNEPEDGDVLAFARQDAHQPDHALLALPHLDALKAVDEKGITFPILEGGSAEGRQVGSDYGVSGIPRLLLVDKDGVVRSEMTGSRPKSDLG